MKKAFKLLFAGAFALIAFAACSDDENETNKDEAYGDSYYASLASVTSHDSNFTANSNGGTISFKASGGSVTLNVNCGCDWFVDNSAADLFPTSYTNTSVTITAEQNTIEEEQTGAFTLKTANEGITFATIEITQAAYGTLEITVETNEWNVPAKGELTTEIAVEASADWTAEAADIWLTVTKTDTGVSLTAQENEDTQERSTRVTLTCMDGVKSAYEYIEVNQDAAAYITLSTEKLSFDNSASSAEVEVTSNFDWECAYDSDWFSVNNSGSTLTVSVEENNDDYREGLVTLTAGDGKGNVAEVQLTVTQAPNGAMILTYYIYSANTKTNLPIYGTDDCALDCVVDWGDGSEPETITEDAPSHTYEKIGEYDIVITGTMPRLYSGKLSSTTKVLPIVEVKRWGDTGLTSMEEAFMYCSDLESLPDYTGDAFANVTTFYQAFHSCTSLKKIPDGIFDNCPCVTTFQGCFGSCSALTEIPAGLFDYCTETLNFSGVFLDAKNIKAIPNGLFKNCVKAENLNSIFRGLASVLEIPADLFDGCVNAQTFQRTFQGCHALTAIPEGLFDFCPATTSFYCTFYDCYNIKEIPEKLFAKNTKVETFYSAFYGCTAIKSIPEGLFDSCTIATNFQAAFYKCSGITSVPVGLFDNCTTVTNFQNTFNGCTKWTGESPYSTINGEKVHLYERSNHTDIFTSPTSTSGCFSSCTGLTDYDDIPSGWK